MKKFVLSFVGLVAASSSLVAGPYSGDTVGTAYNSSAVLEWANGFSDLDRGPMDIQNPGAGNATVGTGASALGQADGSSVVSLGDGGSITLSFAVPIANGAGADFSVFENGFASGASGQAFLELAFVSVSSDGTNFFQFPSVSLTQTATQVGGFGTLDATNLYDLAGKTLSKIGTNFDLSELANVSPLLNINDIQYVKVTDVIGDINPLYATHDSLGNIINDPYSTPFASGGFDLDAIGVLNNAESVPEPGTWALLLTGLALLGWRGRSRVVAVE